MVQNNHITVRAERPGINHTAFFRRADFLPTLGGNFNAVAENPGIQIGAVFFTEFANHFAVYRPRQGVRRRIYFRPAGGTLFSARRFWAEALASCALRVRSNLASKLFNASAERFNSLISLRTSSALRLVTSNALFFCGNGW